MDDINDPSCLYWFKLFSVFHTLTQETVGQICFHFPFAFVYKLLQMSSTLLPYCFLCLLGVIIIFLCNLQITNYTNTLPPEDIQSIVIVNKPSSSNFDFFLPLCSPNNIFLKFDFFSSPLFPQQHISFLSFKSLRLQTPINFKWHTNWA